MRLAIFSSKPYDQQFFNLANQDYGFELHFVIVGS
jgi:hypothetical protein